MAKEPPAHRQIDSELMEPQQSAFSLVLYLGCFASLLLVIITWLGLLAAMSAGLLEWQGWLYVAAPVIAWVLLLALPAMIKARRGALLTLDAITGTAEAWLARAGYSVDLNNDGYVGHYHPQVTPPHIEEHSPRLYTVNGQAKLLAHQAPFAVGNGEQLQPDAEPEPAPRLVRHVWALPNGAKVEQSQLEDFSDRLGTIGWARKDWVKSNKFDREQYDGLISLMETAGIIEGRKKGNAGQLAIKRAADRRRVLGLMEEQPAGGPKNNTEDLAGRYEHIPG